MLKRPTFSLGLRAYDMAASCSGFRKRRLSLPFTIRVWKNAFLFERVGAYRVDLPGLPTNEKCLEKPSLNESSTYAKVAVVFDRRPEGTNFVSKLARTTDD